MSLLIRSMAARMFCCVSARWATRKVEFMPVLNRLAMEAITMRPSAIETVSSSSENPRFVFCLGIIMIFIARIVFIASAEGGDQPIHRVSAGLSPPNFGVADGHYDLFQVWVDGDAIRLQHGIDLNLAVKIGQAHGDVVGRSQHAVRSGENDAFRA